MSMPETADPSAEVRQVTGGDRDLDLLAGGGQELERALPLRIPMVD